MLKLANDNRSRAAELLQIDLGTLQRKLKAWGLDPQSPAPVAPLPRPAS